MNFDDQLTNACLPTVILLFALHPIDTFVVLKHLVLDLLHLTGRGICKVNSETKPFIYVENNL